MALYSSLVFYKSRKKNSVIFFAFINYNFLIKIIEFCIFNIIVGLSQQAKCLLLHLVHLFFIFNQIYPRLTKKSKLNENHLCQRSQLYSRKCKFQSYISSSDLFELFIQTYIVFSARGKKIYIREIVFPQF